MAEEVKEKPAVQAAPVVKVAVPVLAEDSWYYHKDFEPKLFKKGSPVPGEGWGTINKYSWIMDSKNNFNWRKK